MNSKFIIFLLRWSIISFSNVQDVLLKKFSDKESFDVFAVFFSQSVSKITESDITQYMRLMDELDVFDTNLNLEKLNKILCTLIKFDSINLIRKRDILIDFYNFYQKEMHWDSTEFEYSFLLQLEIDKEYKQLGHVPILNLPEELDHYLALNQLDKSFKSINDIIFILFA